MRFKAIPTPISRMNELGKEVNVNKSVFLIFYRTTSIQNKIIKICDSFEAIRYDVSQYYKIFIIVW